MPRLTSLSSLLFLSLVACGGTIGDDQLGGDDQGSGSGSDPGVTVDANCPNVNFMATQVIPSIQLVIDRSGSMDTNLPNTNTSRYEAMHDALVGANGVVGQLQAQVYFGA